MTVLENVKTLLELDNDTEKIYDSQLLLYINGAISDLKANAVPLIFVDSETEAEAFFEAGLKTGDENLIFSYLHLKALQRFDRTLMQTQGNVLTWIDKECAYILYQLKFKYDSLEVQS